MIIMLIFSFLLVVIIIIYNIIILLLLILLLLLGRAMGGTLLFPNGLSNTTSLSTETMKKYSPKKLVAKIGEEKGRYGNCCCCWWWWW